jgi:hypothetical protein
MLASRSVNHDAGEDLLLFSTTMVARRRKSQPNSTQIKRRADELYLRGRGSAVAVRLRLPPSERHAQPPHHHRPPGAAQAPPWPSPQGHDAKLHMGNI